MYPTTYLDIDNWLGDLNTLIARGQASCPPFLKPAHLVSLALSLKANRASSLNLSPHLLGYAVRMGVWEAVGLPPPVSVTRWHAGDRFCEVTRLVDRNHVGDVATRLASIATSNQPAGASDETKKALYTILSEITENCHAHAMVNDGLHGIACAQTWYRGGRAQIAIGDLGIGIRTSLESDVGILPKLAGRNAVDLATEYGVSSKLGRGHSGYGLTLARGLAEASPQSMLYIHSHGEVFHVSSGKTWIHNAPVHQKFPGTLVVFEWAIGSTLDTGDVYRSWPRSEDSSDDDDYF